MQVELHAEAGIEPGGEDDPGKLGGNALGEEVLVRFESVYLGVCQFHTHAAFIAGSRSDVWRGVEIQLFSCLHGLSVRHAVAVAERELVELPGAVAQDLLHHEERGLHRKGDGGHLEGARVPVLPEPFDETAVLRLALRGSRCTLPGALGDELLVSEDGGEPDPATVQDRYEVVAVFRAACRDENFVGGHGVGAPFFSSRSRSSWSWARDSVSWSLSAAAFSALAMASLVI